MINVNKLSYEECRTLANLCEDRIMKIESDELAKIEVTPAEFHTLQTRGRVAAAKELRARTGARVIVACRALSQAEGSFA